MSMLKRSASAKWSHVAMVLVVALAIAACAEGDVADSSESDETSQGTDAANEDIDQEYDQVNWQHQTIAPGAWFGSEAQARFAERVGEASSDAVGIELFPAAGLGVSDSEVFESLAAGVLNIADFFGASTAAEVGVANAVELPFLIPYDPELRREVGDAVRPVFEEVFAERGVQLLALAQLEPRNIYTTTPVESLDDLRGVQLRTVGALETRLTEELGSTPVDVDAAELFTALQQGVVDGYWLTHSTTRDFNFHEAITNVWEINQGGAMWFVGANLDAFEALSTQTQELLREEARKMEEEMWEEVPEVQEEAREFLTEEGITIAEDVSEEDMQAMLAAAEPLWEQWIEDNGEVGQELFDAIESVIE